MMNMKQRVVVIVAGILHLVIALWAPVRGVAAIDRAFLWHIRRHFRYTDPMSVKPGDFYGYMMEWLFITTFAVVLYLLFKDRSPQR